MNNIVEADIYGNINSSHVNGTSVISGIGGALDFAQNAGLPCYFTLSTAKKGALSCIVPSCSHIDITEHEHVLLSQNTVWRTSAINHPSREWRRWCASHIQITAQCCRSTMIAHWNPAVRTSTYACPAGGTWSLAHQRPRQRQHASEGLTPLTVFVSLAELNVYLHLSF